ncbi:hypothetical protein ACLQ26_28890 [Micromonospora sp. DT43]
MGTAPSCLVGPGGLADASLAAALAELPAGWVEAVSRCGRL